MAQLLQITPKVYQLSLGQVNAFLIEDNGFTLVDTGYKNSLSRIFNILSKAGKDPYKIKQIVLTHCHPDHAGSAAAIQQKLNIPIYTHALETPLVEQGISGRLPWQRTPGLMNWIIYTAFIKHADKTNEPASIKESLFDNDELPVAGGLRVIHTPGHSAGHIALLVKSEELLIAGDICGNVAGLQLSTVYENRQEGVRSIKKAADLNFEKAAFGHGKPLMNRASEEMKTHFNPLFFE